MPLPDSIPGVRIPESLSTNLDAKRYPDPMVTTVHQLNLASVNLSGQFNPPDFLDTRIDVYAYLVMMESGVLLIDTGVGEGND